MSSMPTPVADPLRASRLRRLLQRAEQYRAAGQLPAAIASLEQALELSPDHVPTLLQLADLQLLLERHNPARALTLRALGCRLDSPRTAIQLLRMLNRLSESALMLDVVRQLPPPMWDSATSLAEVAHELSLIGAHEPSRAFATAAVQRDPRHPPSLFIAATEAVFHGDLDDAAGLARRCLDVLPSDPGSYWLLSRLRQPEAEARVARIEALLAAGAADEAAVSLGFALHNELHDLKQYDRAWDALRAACAVKRRLLRFDPAAAARLFDALHGWRADEIQADGCDDDRLTPIFVIGLHRSGTTLAERILSGHSQVTAAGETYDIRAQLRRASGLHFNGELDPRVVALRDRLDYRAIGDGFLDSIAWRAGGSRFVTDKLPSNYYNVGFIARALPRARFVHLRRDPIDVGLSSLRTLFSHACPYSYDPLEYVTHYRQYRRLMDHWRTLLPDRILDIDYQSLVDAPEDTAARMARFCGLEFEPGMVQIDRRNDAVATASSVMMRDGIRRDRGKVWKAYEQQLQPMIDALERGDS